MKRPCARFRTYYQRHFRKTLEAVIDLNGRPLIPEPGTADTAFNGGGRSVIPVRESLVYALPELPEFTDAKLIAPTLIISLCPPGPLAPGGTPGC